jgi:N-carbamoylputrescine amidase
MPEPELRTAFPPPASPARTRPAERAPLRLGLVQERWHADPAEHEAALAAGIAMAAAEGATIVCLQELTLSPYFAVTAGGPQAAGAARGSGVRRDGVLRAARRGRVPRPRARVAV